MDSGGGGISDLRFSRSETSQAENTVPSTFTLLPSAADNPFKQTILVSTPHSGAPSEQDSRSDALSALGGAIIQLPYHWEAAAEFSWSRSRYSFQNSGGTIDAATNVAILNGSLDSLRDPRRFPLNYTYTAGSLGALGATPATSSVYTPSLRVAGPLPFELPGGAPVITTLLEQTRNTSTSILSFNNVQALAAPPLNITNVSQLTPAVVLANESAYTNYFPSRSSTTRSAYGEIRLPFIGQDNHIPFARSLEVLISARYDHYEEEAGQPQTLKGVNTSVFCLTAHRPLQPSDLDIACPPASVRIVDGESGRHSTNPTISLRWQVEEDVALRTSYAQGFLPPLLNQLTPNAPVVFPTQAFSALGFPLFHVTDPLRGNEVVGSKVPTVTVLGDDALTRIPELEAMTPADVQASARKYLRPDMAWKAEVTPKEAVDERTAAVFDAMGFGAIDAVDTPNLAARDPGSSAATFLRKIDALARLIETRRFVPAQPSFEDTWVIGKRERLVAIGARLWPWRRRCVAICHVDDVKFVAPTDENTLKVASPYEKSIEMELRHPPRSIRW